MTKHPLYIRCERKIHAADDNMSFSGLTDCAMCGQAGLIGHLLRVTPYMHAYLLSASLTMLLDEHSFQMTANVLAYIGHNMNANKTTGVNFNTTLLMMGCKKQYDCEACSQCLQL